MHTGPREAALGLALARVRYRAPKGSFSDVVTALRSKPSETEGRVEIGQDRVQMEAALLSACAGKGPSRLADSHILQEFCKQLPRVKILGCDLAGGACMSRVVTVDRIQGGKHLLRGGKGE